MKVSKRKQWCLSAIHRDPFLWRLTGAPYNQLGRIGVLVRGALGPTSAPACVVSDLLNLCRASFMSVPSQMVESSNLYEHKLLLPLHSFFQPKSREGRHVSKRS